MARSQMRERFRVFSYSAPTVSGVPTDTYTMVPSGEPDGAFFAARGIPSGRELSIAAARDHKADAVVVFPDDTPLDEKCLLRDMADDRLYLIVAPIQHARQRGELQAVIESSRFADDDTVVIAGEP